MALECGSDAGWIAVKPREPMFVVAYRCERHGHPSLVFQMEHGGGTRVLGFKCCERMYEHEIARWQPTDLQWETFAREAEDCGA